MIIDKRPKAPTTSYSILAGTYFCGTINGNAGLYLRLGSGIVVNLTNPLTLYAGNVDVHDYQAVEVDIVIKKNL